MTFVNLPSLQRVQLFKTKSDHQHQSGENPALVSAGYRFILALPRDRQGTTHQETDTTIDLG